MARAKAATASPSYNTLQNACYWLATRPDEVDIASAVALVSLLFQKTEDEIRKRMAVIRQMAR